MFSLRRILTASLVLLATVPALLVLWMMSRASTEAVEDLACGNFHRVVVERVVQPRAEQLEGERVGPDLRQGRDLRLDHREERGAPEDVEGESRHPGNLGPARQLHQRSPLVAAFFGDRLTQAADAVHHTLPVWRAAIIVLPAYASGDAVRVQVHGGEVIQRGERDAAVEPSLHGGVARVVVFVAQGQVGDVALDVLQHGRHDQFIAIHAKTV